ncbi:MAG: tRNA lysidine(34) synthetase TilS [Candidatus Auribacterota bacterium]
MITHDPYIEQLNRSLLNNGLISSGDIILLGLSGGPDSVFLFHLLFRMQTDIHLNINVVHINHMLRGAESGLDEQFVLALCEEHNVPCTIIQEDIQSIASKNKVSIEMAARSVRYEAFAQAARQTGSTMIMTAHTADDRIETALMRLINGTSLKGLTGLRTVSELNNLKLVRPLLPCWKKDILSCLERNSIPYRIDSSNTSHDYLRNRIRHNLIPLLNESYNPSFNDTFIHTLDLMQKQSECMTDYTQKAYNDCLLSERAYMIFFDRAKLMELNDAVLGDILHQALFNISDTPLRPAYSHTMDAVRAIRQNECKVIEFPAGMRVVSDRLLTAVLHSSTLNRFFNPGGFDTIIDTPAPFTFSPFCTITISGPDNPHDTASVLNDDFWKSFFISGKTTITSLVRVPEYSNVRVRNRNAGDRIQLSFGTKKLKDLFIDSRIPVLLRNIIPVLTTGDEIAWAVGITDKNLNQRFNKTFIVKIELTLQAVF